MAGLKLCSENSALRCHFLNVQQHRVKTKKYTDETKKSLEKEENAGQQENWKGKILEGAEVQGICHWGWRHEDRDRYIRPGSGQEPTGRKQMPKIHTWRLRGR